MVTHDPLSNQFRYHRHWCVTSSNSPKLETAEKAKKGIFFFFAQMSQPPAKVGNLSIGNSVL